VTLAFYSTAETLAEVAVTTAEQSDIASLAVKVSTPEADYLGETATAFSLDKPLYDFFTVAERNERDLPTALPVLEPYYGEKTVYLTFDDGPNSENTPLVLDILKSYGIKATFFMIGTQIENHHDIVKRVYDEGHAIGNHSYNHIYRELYQSAAAYTAQLQHTDDLIKNAIGVRPRISRAPGGSVGSFTKEYWNILKVKGYIEVGWNVSSGDASRAKASQIINNIASQMEKKYLWSHAIVLMHDGQGHEETVKALPEIIKLYKERGFEFRIINLKTPPAW
jgi:peptidoglycan/xylan/chitin deacetylase (PgdA/CDA1 family)